MNILCSYKKKGDEKTFFVAGVKKKNLRRSKMALYIIFFLFLYQPHKMSFRHETFLHG